MNPESNDEQPGRGLREHRAQPMPAITPTIEHDRLDYRIGELTDAHYRLFVDQAFHALLKRAPAVSEVETQIALLAAGATKAELLGNLRWSPEGRRVGTRVAGLLPRYAAGKLGRVTGIGYLLDLCINFAALPLLARHQRASDTRLDASNEASAAADRALAAHIELLDPQVAVLRQRIDDLHTSVQQLARQLADAEFRLRGRTESLEGRMAAHDGRVEEFEFIRQRFYAINHWTHSLDQAFAQIEQAATGRRSRYAGFAARVALEAVAADRDRVTRNATWADTLAQRLPEQATVLALASGGDWLDALGGRGLRALAAEPDAALAGDADAGGFEPVAPRQLLQRSADASVDGISALAFPSLVRSLSIAEFLDHALRVLRPGGSLLLAFAQEPVALVDVLLGEAAPVGTPELIPHALAAAGFVDIVHADAADGTIAFLARPGSPGTAKLL